MAKKRLYSLKISAAIQAADIFNSINAKANSNNTDMRPNKIRAKKRIVNKEQLALFAETGKQSDQLIKTEAMENKIFDYKGTPITFQIGNGNIIVNLTEMAKPFGKMPAHFLSNDQTKRYINVLAKTVTIGFPIVKTVEGKFGGTWGHQKLALKFAAWLSAEFELWVYDRIEELLKFGITATIETIDRIITNPDFGIKLLTALKEANIAKDIAEKARILAEQQKELAEQNVELHKKVIKEQAPKVEYHDKVLNSPNLLSVNDIAIDLGISNIKLNKILDKSLHIQYKQGDRWFLHPKYRGLGYTKDKTFTHLGTDGKDSVTISMYWTQEGKRFIYRECIKRIHKLPEIMQANIEKLNLK
jgi:phage antirepressor YoqD-like protein